MTNDPASLQDEIRRIAAQFPQTGTDAPVFTAAKRWEFLARLSLCGNVNDAARRSGVNVSTVNGRIRGDAGFAEQVKDALAEGVGRMESEAFRRAVEGTDKPVFQKGDLVGYVREYSDSLLALLLRRHDPAYAASSSRVEVSGPGGGPIAHADMTPQRRRILAAEILAAAQRDDQAEAASADVDPLS